MTEFLTAWKCKLKLQMYVSVSTKTYPVFLCAILFTQNRKPKKPSEKLSISPKTTLFSPSQEQNARSILIMCTQNIWQYPELGTQSCNNIGEIIPHCLTILLQEINCYVLNLTCP
ncbi:hypothetical protein R5R35_010420 [Gryllus longicercus]|uniref:Uncharacterized protein n=1 Tax=Gryllus longicercus TaxID=2509291 RepID=A0AAN9VKG6_9ORTH